MEEKTRGWTAGPWKLGKVRDGFVEVDAPTHGALATVVWHMEDDRILGESSPAQEANACLIAAAPDLYEALDDPKVCDEMKADIREWFDGGGYLKPALSASGPSGGGGEDQAWSWLDARENSNPADRDFSADEMVDAFMAGAAESGLRQAFAKFVSAIKRAPISWETGVCCCGTDIKDHSISDNHGPVDAGEYFISKAIKEAEAALSAPGSGAVKPDMGNPITEQDQSITQPKETGHD